MPQKFIGKTLKDQYDFLSWVHPSGHKAYLLLRVGKGVRGLEFDRVIPKSDVVMGCSFCRFTARGKKIALFSIEKPKDKKKKVGLYVCSNFDCLQRLSSTIGPDQPYETLTQIDKVERFKRNFRAFVDRLFFEI